MAILVIIPWTVFYILGCIVTVPGIPWLRLKTEGKAFSVSYSAAYGDLALTCVIAVGAGIATRITNAVLIWDTWFNILLALVLIAAGVIMQRLPNASQRPVDVAHSLIAIPVYGYLVVISELVLFQSGHELAYLVGLAGPSIWLYLVIKDTRENRLDQHGYMARTGETAIPGLRCIVNFMNGIPAT